jgi:hypothetical protein
MCTSNTGLELSNLKTQYRNLQQSKSTDRQRKINKIEQEVSAQMRNPVNGFPIKWLQTDSSKFAEWMEIQLSKCQNYTKQTWTDRQSYSSLF